MSDDEKIVEAMAIAMCNFIRYQHQLPPLRSLDGVEKPDYFRGLANTALRAYREKRLGH